MADTNKNVMEYVDKFLQDAHHRAQVLHNEGDTPMMRKKALRVMVGCEYISAAIRDEWYYQYLPESEFDPKEFRRALDVVEEGKAEAVAIIIALRNCMRICLGYYYM